MCKPNDMTLSLNSDTFASLKKDFDSILAQTLGNMEMKGAEDATITIKLTVSTTKQSVNAMGVVHNFTKPSFKHDISSVMQIKAKASGQFAGDYAMVYDNEEGWVLRKIVNGQMSMFDEEPTGSFSDYEIVDEDQTEPVALPAPTGLPEPREVIEEETSEEADSDMEFPDPDPDEENA